MYGSIVIDDQLSAFTEAAPAKRHALFNSLLYIFTDILDIGQLQISCILMHISLLFVSHRKSQSTAVAVAISLLALVSLCGLAYISYLRDDSDVLISIPTLSNEAKGIRSLVIYIRILCQVLIVTIMRFYA